MAVIKSNLLVIVNRIFVHEFYRIHWSVFFMIIAFAGGFMRAIEHIALGELFISSNYLLLIPISVWVAFAFFINDFNRQTIRKPENQFLSSFLLLSRSAQWSIVVIVSANQLMTTILYGSFLIALALRNNLLLPVVVVTISLGIIIILNAYFLRQKLIHIPVSENTFNSILGRMRHFAKPFIFIVFRTVLPRQILSLTAYKLASIALLWSALYLYGTDTYDLRLIGLASTMAFSLGIAFVTEWHLAENHLFSIYRSLPFSFRRRLGYALLIIIIFILPEIFILLRNFPPGYHPVYNILLISYGISIHFLWYSFLYTKDSKRETVIGIVSAAAIIFFLLILASTPLVIIVAINLIIGIFLYGKYYDRFEYEALADDLIRK
jgi:hypothetical protein